MKGFLMALALCLWLPVVASAQAVVVSGAGMDRAAAMKDASRHAVEQVVGTFLDSRTLVRDAKTELDEIYTHAQGFVKSCEVLQENSSEGGVIIQARVEVETNPDTELMDRLQMVMSLNDPRLSVVVLSGGEDGYGLPRHDEVSENALNAALLEQGFNKVVDAQMVSQLNSDELLWQIASGTGRLAADTSQQSLDYLVLCRSTVSAYNLGLGGEDDGGLHMSRLLHTGQAELTAKIIDYSTGRLCGTFTVTGKGLENSEKLAEGKAKRLAAQKAAKELQKKFRQLGARSLGER